MSYFDSSQSRYYVFGLITWGIDTNTRKFKNKNYCHIVKVPFLLDVFLFPCTFGGYVLVYLLPVWLSCGRMLLAVGFDYYPSFCPCSFVRFDISVVCMFYLLFLLYESNLFVFSQV